MAIYHRNVLSRLEHPCRIGTNNQKGKALEKLICHLFKKVPGVVIYDKDILNHFESEEIDIAVWNYKHKKGLSFLEEILLIECKNWTTPIGSVEVAWFDHKLKSRNQRYGVLVVVNGITGDPLENTSSHQIITQALAEGRRLLVFSLNELLQINNTDELVHKFQDKLCELAVKGTVAI